MLKLQVSCKQNSVKVMKPSYKCRCLMLGNAINR